MQSTPTYTHACLVIIRCNLCWWCFLPATGANTTLTYMQLALSDGISNIMAARYATIFSTGIVRHPLQCACALYTLQASFNSAYMWIEMVAFNLLGHCLMWQATLSCADPVHLLPPQLGNGLLHERLRVRTPEPHVLEQLPYPDQWDHCPLTSKRDDWVGFRYYVSSQDYRKF